jgi:hydroxyacid-oxoacid transhydrogenase
MERDTVFTFHASRVKYGQGSTSELGEDLASLDLRRAVLVADPALRPSGLTDRVVSSIRAAGIDLEVFEDVHCEPTDVAIKPAIEYAQQGKFDGYVGLGGGSALDTAKIMNLYSSYPDDLLAYINRPIGEGKPLPGPLKPMVGVPTTAGTASENTAVAVIDFLDMKVKTGISHRYIRPQLAILDPANTVGAPPGVTACTGIDVLTHAAESYTCRKYDTRPKPDNSTSRPAYVGANPIGDIWCPHAIRAVREFLPRAVRDGNDLEARDEMMKACMYAGMGFSNAGCHLPHAMGYPIAGMVRDFHFNDYGPHPLIPHGMSTAVGAPAAMSFMVEALPDRFADVAAWLGNPVKSNDVGSIRSALNDALVQLLQEIGLPNGLGAMGYERSDIPALVNGTLKQERLMTLCPRPVSPSELERIFDDSMENW